MINTLENNYTEAVIYLKNGKRKHGMLLDKIVNDAYQFISNHHYNQLKKDSIDNYIEIVPSNLIETIDISLK